MPEQHEGGEPTAEEGSRPIVTRRDFLIGAGAGVAVAGAAGAVVISTRPAPGAPPPVASLPTVVRPPTAAPPTTVPQPTPMPQPTAVPAPAAASVETGAIAVTLKINGVERQLNVQPNWTLLYVLREQLDMTGTRYGCDRGMCGMCTVVLNSKPVYSCMNLAVQWDGAEVMTVEGLATPDGQLHPLQQAFIQNNAFQCAWCTSGFLMSSYALLSANPKPGLVDIKAAVAGNACRCGTYPRVFRAIAAAAPTFTQAPAQKSQLPVVGPVVPAAPNGPAGEGM
jgi:aerobic-type carbon monoxide dehydrogenase small subunit (CoxS/CutS family)